jgi:hypothetical protein
LQQDYQDVADGLGNYIEDHLQQKHVHLLLQRLLYGYRR